MVLPEDAEEEDADEDDEEEHDIYKTEDESEEKDEADDDDDDDSAEKEDEKYNLQSLIDIMQAKEALEVELPTLCIADEVNNWAGYTEQQERYKYPLEEPDMPDEFLER